MNPVLIDFCVRLQNCTFKFLDCFLMEMNVLLHEEDPTNENKNKNYKLMIETTLAEYNKHVSQSNTTTCVKIHHSELTWLNWINVIIH